MVGLIDIFRVAGERCPAKWPNALAEQRANISRDKAREVKSVFYTDLFGHLADIVAVIHCGRTALLQCQHGAHLHRHGLTRRPGDGTGIFLALLFGLRQCPAAGQVAVQRVVGGGLVGHHVRRDVACYQFGENVSGVGQQTNRDCLALRFGLFDQGQCLIERGGFLVQVAGLQAKVDPRLIHFTGQHGKTGHGGCQWLSTTHTAQPAGENPLASGVAIEMGFGHRHKGFVGALHNPLRADVNPRTSGHLAVHHQALLIQLVKVIPVGPVRHNVGVGNEHSGRFTVGLEHAYRLTGLDQQGFILLQPFEGGDDLVVAGPVPGCPADAAVDHQLLRVFGHFRVKVIHQHPQRCLHLPAASVQLTAPGGADGALWIKSSVSGYACHDYLFFNDSHQVNCR